MHRVLFKLIRAAPPLCQRRPLLPRTRVCVVPPVPVLMMRRARFSTIHAPVRFNFAAPTDRPTIFQLSTAGGDGSGKPARAGVAVIRISGPHALSAFQTLRTNPAKPNSRARQPPVPRRATLCRLYAPTPTATPTAATTTAPAPTAGAGAVLDDSVIGLYFPAPHSFTGEDVVELHVHGNPVVVNAVLRAIATLNGCRLAAAGEFTRRAFTNGKLDLTQVEALADLLAADTELQRDQALTQFGGALSRTFRLWRDELIACLAHVEAVIDFGEDEKESVSEDNTLKDVRARIAVLRRSIQLALNDARRGERIRSGLAVAIVGPPNAGKSTLLNALAQRDVAIVSSIPGTTRDVLEVSLNLSGYPVTVADTAGLRAATNDLIEREGMRRARDRMASADLKVAVFDAYTTLIAPAASSTSTGSAASGGILTAAGDEFSHAAEVVDRNTIVVFNKADLLVPKSTHATATAPAATSGSTRATSAASAALSAADDTTPAAITALWNDTLHARALKLFSGKNLPAAVCLVALAPGSAATATATNGAVARSGDSAVSGFGIHNLLNTVTHQITKRLEQAPSPHADASAAGAGTTSTAAVITRERHRQHLQQCLTLIESFESTNGRDLVLAAEELRSAARSLSAVVGAIDVDQLLDVIFRDFCIGK